MARAKRKLPAKPAAFISQQHRSHFCRRHPIPEHKAPAADNTHPTKTHDPIKRHQPAPEHKAPAADDNTHPTKTSRPDQTAPTGSRTQSPRRRRQYTPHKNLTARSNGTDRRPNTKKPAAAPNTTGRFHFSAPPRSLLPPSSDTRTQSPRRRRQYTPHKNPRPGQTAPTDARTQSPRRRSEHRRPFPLSLKKPQRCLNAIVQRQPPPAGAQHHLTQPNPNISGRRFTAFFALRCL